VFSFCKFVPFEFDPVLIWVTKTVIFLQALVEEGTSQFLLYKFYMLGKVIFLSLHHLFVIRLVG